ncbi:hypothetical protein [Blastopirellula marina]|uniref:Uncharacterized protein n=1 Tax=Blastopirellula marina DSM 3645 TaxID=314230 RepID=A3ZSN7_9BACT|nr:hypothetical protein [Blastopirellula marina]EAQ80309.1 hypothetical protein DSM3645_10707 [Blastopirellula marina DSM 3645]
MSGDNETPNEMIGGWIAAITIILPSMIVSGFMPEWNALPYFVWLAIAGAGGAVGAAIYTLRWIHGGIGGAVMGVGAVVGVHAYVILRSMLIDSGNFFSLELLIGAGLGALPGLVYLSFVASASDD